jgi:hypothetical protein
LPGLLTYTTDLKSLRYGKDRPDGGDSNQPYIKKDIPAQEDGRSFPDSKDFILRGGIGSPIDVADDFIRLGKYFADFKNINGALFVAKQNILSRVGTATQASGNQSTNDKWKSAALNEGIYTPLSTLVQSGVNIIGGHIDKQGINPITGVRTYTDVISRVIGSEGNGKGNRLVDLADSARGVFSGPTIFSYSGGPNSTLGIGRTNINYSTDNKGATLRTLGNESFTDSFIKNQTGARNSDTNRDSLKEEFRQPLGVSKQYATITNGKINFDGFGGDIYATEGGGYTGQLASVSKATGVWAPLANSEESTGQVFNLALGKVITPSIYNRTPNPTNLFKYPEPEDLKDASGLYGFISQDYFDVGTVTGDDGISLQQNLTNPYVTGVKGTLATKKYVRRNNRITIDPTINDFVHLTGSKQIFPQKNITQEQYSVYKSGSLNPTIRIEDQNTNVFDTNLIQESSNNSKLNKIDPGLYQQDFRTKLKVSKDSTIISTSPDYENALRTVDGKSNSRINYVSPGQKGIKHSYSKGKKIAGKTSITDRINALPLYKSSNVQIAANGDTKNDLVKFRIAAIDTNNPSQKVFMHFRAYIDQFSDAYNASWNEQKYMGRGESFYKYDNFKRSINLAFTVMAQSKPELMVMYRKLNYLASNLAPDYTTAGFMSGPLVQLTMGGWCYELPGFINSLTLEVPQESPWEIAINDTVSGGKGTGDRTVKEMPHMVKVSGFTFTPIHEFRPGKMKLTKNMSRPSNNLADNNEYGKERYLDLSIGGGKDRNNYDTTVNNDRNWYTK